MRFIKYLIMAFPFLLLAQVEKSNISLFIPKSPISALRAYIPSRNITYFENSSGGLYMSKGLKNIPLIESKKERSSFTTKISTDYKYLLIEENLNSTSNMSLRQNHKIYWHDTFTQKAQMISYGHNPKFHAGNTLISVIDINEQSIKVKNIKTLRTQAYKFSNGQNPYFIPDVTIKDDLLIFNQINKKGLQDLISINMRSKKVKTLYQSSTINSIFSSCLSNEKIYFYKSGKKKSEILEFTEKLIKKMDINGSIAQMICHKDYIYFVKDKVYLSKSYPNMSDLIKVSTKKFVPIRISRLPGNSSLFKNASEIFILNNSKYYKVIK